MREFNLDELNVRVEEITGFQVLAEEGYGYEVVGILPTGSEVLADEFSDWESGFSWVKNFVTTYLNGGSYGVGVEITKGEQLTFKETAS